jgi:O-antigen ligase
MIVQESQGVERVISGDIRTVPTPSAFVEYGFYFYMFYTLVGGVLGVAVNNLASALLVLLLLFCLAEVGSHALGMVRILAFPLGCGIVYTFIQLFFFEESLTIAVRPFLIWMVILFIVQLLASRENFLHKFVLVMFFIGLVALPYLSIHQTVRFQRASLDKGIGFGHINEMAAWYGFCTVYFAVLGFIVKTNALRGLSWMTALGCLYVTTLTVSRGALLAVAISIVIAGRKFLKNGFLPVLLFACLGWIVVELGIFEETAKSYATRGTEDTGRLAVWPLIIDSFLDSPWIGVGHSHVGAYTGPGKFVTPHNSFLYVAQSSGIVPLVLFIAYWLSAARAAFSTEGKSSPEAIFYLPMLIFSFLLANSLTYAFLELWAIVSLAIPLKANVQRQALETSRQLRN